MKCLDIYGEPLKIFLSNNYFIKTSIGGFFTIITIALLFVFTWFIGKDIIYKEKPISYMQTDIFKDFANINITNNNFPFSITMMDDNGTPLLDFTFLTIKLYELTFELNLNSGILELTNKNEYPIKFCNYSDFNILSKKQFQESQLGFTLCPVNNNFNLYGYWNEDKLNFLQISLELCKNITDSQIICKTPNEIKKYIVDKSVNMAIFYVDSRVVINNNTNPIEFLTRTNFKYIIPEYHKRTFFKIQTQNIFTDNGFIFSQTENSMFFKMVEEFTDLKSFNNDDNQFFSYEIYSSNNSDSYYRRYIKVPDIMASLGGILKVFTMTFLFINSIFSNVEKNISLVNEVFALNKKTNNMVTQLYNKNPERNFNSLNISEKNVFKNINRQYIGIHQTFRNNNPNFIEAQKITSIHKEKSITEIKNDNLHEKFDLVKSNANILAINNNLNTSKVIEKSASSYNEENVFKMQTYMKLRKSETKINFSFKDRTNIICNNYCKMKISKSSLENFNFYKKAKNSVEQFFDFIFMIKKFQEINIVKKCLFTPEQYKMVEIMSKPILSSKEFEKLNETMYNNEDFDEYGRDVDRFLMKINTKKINKNIMKIIDEDIDKSYI